MRGFDGLFPLQYQSDCIVMSEIDVTPFLAEIAASASIWTIQDDSGIPSTVNSEGEGSMPFWSSRQRALDFMAAVPGYAGFEPMEIAWDVFAEKWAPGLDRDDLLAGLNWEGSEARGLDLEPFELVEKVESLFA